MRTSLRLGRPGSSEYPIYTSAAAAQAGDIGRTARVDVRATVLYEYVRDPSSPPLPTEGNECDGMGMPSTTLYLNGADLGGSLTYAYEPNGAWIHAPNQPAINPGMNSATLWVDGVQRAIVYLNVEAHPTPTISLAAHNGENIDPSKCVADCFEKVQVLSTPAYVSLSQPRSLSLVYRSGRAAPRGEVTVEFTPVLTYGAKVPDRLKVGLKRNWPGDTTMQDLIGPPGTKWHYFAPTNDAVQRLAVQFDATTMATSAYDYKTIVLAEWNEPDGIVSKQLVADTRVLVNNESNSEFGAGWMPSEMQRLAWTPQGVVVTTGAGHALYFHTNGAAGDTNFYSSPKGDFSKLILLRSQNKVIRSFADGSRAIFEADQRRISRLEDRFGNTVQYQYNGTQLYQIVDPAGKATQIGYELGGCWCKTGTLRYITTPGGRQNWYAVDQANNLLHAQSVTGAYLDMDATYEGARMVGFKDALSKVWRTSYDQAGHIAADSTPLIGTAEQGNVSLFTRYRSVASLITASGSAANRMTPQPMVSKANAMGRITPPAGEATEFAVDRFGNPVMMRRAGQPNTEVTMIRDDHGRVQSASGPIAGSWSAVTWQNDLPTRLTSSEGVDVKLTYGPFAQVDSVYGTTTRLKNYFDANGNIESTRTGVGASAKVTRFERDARGLVWQVVPPDARDTTTIFRQVAGPLNVDSIRQGKRVTRYGYDQFGRVIVARSPDGERDSVQFDALNRMLSSWDNAGSWTRTEYDALGLKAVIDAKSQRYDYHQNAAGMDTVAARPPGPWLTYMPDNRGLTRYVDNRRNQRTWIESDSLGRPTRVTRGAGAITFKYEPSGKYTVATSAASVDTIFTDSSTVQREVSVRANGMVFETTRQLNMQTRHLYTTTRLREGGSVAPWSTTWVTVMDSSWRVVGITPDGATPTILAYGAPEVGDTAWIGGSAERAIVRHRPNGEVQSIDYNNSSLSLTYGLDSAGRVSFRQHGQEPSSGNYVTVGTLVDDYRYDNVGRLDRWTRGNTAQSCLIMWGGSSDGGCTVGGGSATYTYDAVGNPVAGASVQLGNRLVALGDTTMHYDPDGNLDTLKTPSERLTLWWSSTGQLDSTHSTVHGKVRYEYDGFGRRIVRRTDQAIDHYVYLGDQVMVDAGSDGAWWNRYTYYPGIDRPHTLTQRNGGTYWYVEDGRGTVTGLVDAGGTLQAKYDYTPFGGDVASSTTFDNVGNRFRYNGREWDGANGLYFNRARYYSPLLRRFISEDPVGLAGGINLYTYALNNPVSWSDPYGASPCESESWHDDSHMDGMHSYTVVHDCDAERAALEQLLDRLRGVGTTPGGVPAAGFNIYALQPLGSGNPTTAPAKGAPVASPQQPQTRMAHLTCVAGTIASGAKFGAVGGAGIGAIAGGIMYGPRYAAAFAVAGGLTGGLVGTFGGPIGVGAGASSGATIGAVVGYGAGMVKGASAGYKVGRVLGVVAGAALSDKVCSR